MKLRHFPNHTGVWEGDYIRIAANGDKLDQWKSRLTIRLLGDDAQYHQVNEYFWDDGHYECHDFGLCNFNSEGKLIFDNPRIDGYAWETDNSVCLTWTYKDRPGSRLYEMIDLIGDGKHRIRVWKWAYQDTFEGLTMIEERKVANQADVPDSFWGEAASKRFMGESRSNK